MTAAATSMSVTRDQLRKYREVVALWCARFDTQSIAERTKLPEHLVARWVANFRDIVRGAA